MAATPAPTYLITEYVVPAVIGAIGGIVGGIVTAGAMLLNGNRQRKQDRALESDRITESRKGVRREIEARLRELARHIATFRINGFGASGAMRATFERLQTLMQSPDGPASLSSDELVEEIYSMLQTARLNLQYLDYLSEKDNRQERNLPVSDLQDWIEKCQIRNSNVIEQIRLALKLFEHLGDHDSVEMLLDTEAHYEKRFKEYSQCLDARVTSQGRACRPSKWHRAHGIKTALNLLRR
jgi:hypothetical protein